MSRHSSVIYAVYRGDEILCTGTANECAAFMGIKKTSFYFYTAPAYQRRLEKWKNPRKHINVIKLDDEDED